MVSDDIESSAPSDGRDSNHGSTGLFRSSWSIYEAIAERNYMFHREIHARVTSVLAERHRGGGYTMLDLGCGDARFVAPSLAAHPPQRYEGVDLSRPALDEAAMRLRGLPAVTLHEQDMLQHVTAGTAIFDLIYSSFAVHHLEPAAKQRLFAACASRLAPGGEFLLIDVVREPDQTRDQYLEAYLHRMRSTWTAVDARELEEACRHVAEHDYPETLPALTEMAARAGFGQTRLLDRFGPHQVVQFRR